VFTKKSQENYFNYIL